jgi:hypothetical protein
VKMRRNATFLNGVRFTISAPNRDQKVKRKKILYVGSHKKAIFLPLDEPTGTETPLESTLECGTEGYLIVGNHSPS